MSKKKVIIVGAGIAGLSAGSYLQMNGYETAIYEAHHMSGGLCTSWSRNGYLIDGCIHGLLGSNSTHPLYNLWNELIAMDQVSFKDEEIKHMYLFEDGTSFSQSANLDILQKKMIEIAPEDEHIVRDFIQDIRALQSVELPYDKPKEFIDLPGKLKLLKSLPTIPVIKKWLNVSSDEFSKRFNNELLQNVVKHFSSPILFEMFVMSEMDLKRCGYPTMGSREFAKLFENKYISSGGKLHLNKKVKSVLTRDHSALGIVLENGEQHTADMIVLAMDGRTAIYDLLKGKFVGKVEKKEYEKADLNSSRIQISIGLKGEVIDWPKKVKIILSSPLSISDGSSYSLLDCQIFKDEASLNSLGKSVVIVQLVTKSGEYWTNLRSSDIEKYKQEKKYIADNVIRILDMKIPGFKERIEVIDVATPATYVRYTGNWKGSIQGWSNENIFKKNPFKKQLPGLRNLYLIGQWVEPGGGLPNAFTSGRDVAQIICKKNRKRFTV